MAKTKSPIVYIGGPGYSYQYFEPRLGEIQSHFESIVQGLKATNKDGKQIEINLKIDVSNPEKVRAYAKRLSKDSAEYLVFFSAGFSYHLWLASRIAQTDYEFFSWAGSCKLSNLLRSEGRKKALANYIFYLVTYHTILHELAHIYLGHCDYVQDQLNMAELDEFGAEKKLSSEEIRIFKGIEAEADRQASEWLVGFFENSLGPSRRGVELMFPSRIAAYEFLVFSLNTAFVLNQQLTLRQDPTHPLPNQRQYTAISSIRSGLQKMKDPDVELIANRASIFMMEAAKKTGLLGAQSIQELVETAISMAYVDDVIKETGIRKFQHKFEI